MKTTSFLLLFFFVFSAFAKPKKDTTTTVMIGEGIFVLEIAADEKTRQYGLMNRKELPADRGMLFAFPDDLERRFWMYNTLIDLDIVYLDKKGKVVSIRNMKAEPKRGEHESQQDYEDRLPRYPSGKPARYAIELNAGTAESVGLRKGDSIILDFEALEALLKNQP